MLSRGADEKTAVTCELEPCCTGVAAPAVRGAQRFCNTRQPCIELYGLSQYNPRSTASLLLPCENGSDARCIRREAFRPEQKENTKSKRILFFAILPPSLATYMRVISKFENRFTNSMLLQPTGARSPTKRRQASADQCPPATLWNNEQSTELERLLVAFPTPGSSSSVGTRPHFILHANTEGDSSRCIARHSAAAACTGSSRPSFPRG